VKLLFADLHESGFRIVFCCALLRGAMSISVAAENAQGVTDSEIKSGQTMPYTGPVTHFSAPGLAEMPYMGMINDQGRINGRKINLISVDDGHLPWRTAKALLPAHPNRGRTARQLETLAGVRDGRAIDFEDGYVLVEIVADQQIFSVGVDAAPSGIPPTSISPTWVT
jgi:hypothetical protein